MNEIRQTLAAHPFFAGLSDRRIDTLAAFAFVRELPAGEWLAHTGADADTFYALVHGRAGIEIHAADRHPLVVATVHSGDVIGWSWFVEPHRWHFDVVALDDLRLLAIDAPRLRAECAVDHELGFHVAAQLTRVLASRLEAARHQLVDVYGLAR